MDFLGEPWRTRTTYHQAAIALISLVMVLCLSVVLSEVGAAEQDDALLINNQGRFDLQATDFPHPVVFNLTVEVGTDKPQVKADYEVEGFPKGWIYFFGGETEQVAGTDLEFIYKSGRAYNLTLMVLNNKVTLADTYWFNVKGTLRENTSATDKIVLGVLVNQYADFELTLWNRHASPFRAYPGTTVEIPLALYNLGNGPDRFLVEGIPSLEDKGWTLMFESGLDDEGSTRVLASDISRERPYLIIASVLVPVDVFAGTWTQVSFQALSMFNKSIKKEPLYIRVFPIHYYQFDVYTKETYQLSEGTGGEVEFQITIHNTGNGWDTFAVRPIWDTTDNPRFVAGADPRHVDTDAGEMSLVRYIVKVPEEAIMGMYVFSAEVRSSSPELPSTTVWFTVEVPQVHRLEFSESIATVSVLPGALVVHETQISNMGNGMEHLDLHSEDVPKGWIAWIQPKEVDLWAQKSMTIQVMVSVPRVTDPMVVGTFNLTVRAESLSMKVSTSQILSIEVGQYYHVDWVQHPDTILNQSINPYERQVFNEVLELKNHGSGRDKVDITSNVTFSGIYVSLFPNHVVLEANEKKVVKVTISIERTVPPGTYTFPVIAISTEDPAPVARSVSVGFTVYNIDVCVPPIPTFIDPKCGNVVRAELSLVPHSNRSFKFKLENNGTVPTGRVLVRAFDIYWTNLGEVRELFFEYTTPSIPVGDRFIVGERPFTQANPPLYWWANRTGEHTLEFRVILAHQSDTINDVSRLNLTVYDKPPPPGPEDPPDRLDNWDVIWVLFGILIVSTIVGIHEWIKEMEKPLRPW